MSTEYGVSLKELQDLMEFRGQEAKEEVLKLGGVETITKKLKDRAEIEKLEGLLSTRRGRGRHETVSRKILSPRDRVPEFFSPRDGPPKLSPGIRNPGPGLLDPGDPVPDADPWSQLSLVGNFGFSHLCANDIRKKHLMNFFKR